MSERKVATDALETLGTILGDDQRRDAIHLAVEPVIAGERLQPGEHITVEKGIAMAVPTGKGLGIVDPFLNGPVKRGERFWFVMYPRMVHSLRHVWTHPAFPDEVKPISDAFSVFGVPVVQVAAGTDALPQRDVPAFTPPFTKAYSEEWLRNFIANADCPSYRDVMDAIESGDFDEYAVHIRGQDASGEIPSEFWDHVENALGRKVPYRPAYFSCSC